MVGTVCWHLMYYFAEIRCGKKLTFAGSHYHKHRGEHATASLFYTQNPPSSSAAEPFSQEKKEKEEGRKKEDKIVTFSTLSLLENTHVFFQPDKSKEFLHLLGELLPHERLAKINGNPFLFCIFQYVT